METTKIKLLRVLDILRETDEDNPCTANEIVKKLRLYGLEAERKSVLRDIAALQEYGCDILLHADNKRGYYMASREFEDWELKLLADAALNADFLTPENRQRLAEKIVGLASVNGRKTLRTATPAPSSGRNGTPHTKNTIDVLLRAIRQGKKVGFRYVYTGADLKKHLRFQGHEYPVSPYALIRRQDRYFLIGCYGSYETPSYYRLERIRDIEILDEPAVPLEKLFGKNADLRLREFIDRNLNNYSGKTVLVTLAVDKDRVDLLVDAFGENFRVERETADQLIVRTKVNDGWGLTEWLLQNGECVQALGPAAVRAEVFESLDKIRANYEKNRPSE